MFWTIRYLRPAAASKLSGEFHVIRITERCRAVLLRFFGPLRPPQSTLKELQMKKPLAVVILLALTTAGVWAAKSFKERLGGYQEVPAVSTTGNGEFKARISKDGSQIDWELRYADLEGAVTQAHIHFGQANVNGGVSVFLCTNLGNGPAGTQPCPAPPATISGTIVATDVVGPSGQGISAGELDELIDAIRAGMTYVNVHSTLHPGGEIRAQIGGRNHDHDD